jgi:AraC-like DNA-binding protein
MSGFQYTEKTGCSNCQQLESHVRKLEAERDEYKRQADGYYQEAATAYETRNKAIELLSERYTDLNRDGKTILDFQNTWIRQTRDENDKLRAERDRLSKALITVQDERAASFAMLQKAVGEPYGLTPYQPEVDLEIESNIQKLRARHAALVKAAKDLTEDYERLIGDGVTNDNQPPQLTKLKAALAEVK